MNRLRLFALALGAVILGMTGVPASAQPAPAADSTPPSTGEAAVEREAYTPPAAARPAEGARYEPRLRELEERVVGLKEAVFKAKTRLMLLQEEILQNVIAEAKAVIIHHNDMGSAFTLERVIYYLDTNRIYVQDNRDGQLDKNPQFEIFNGNLVPGNHLLTVEMEYRGNGTVFAYLDQYRFELKSSYTFYAAKGRVLQLSVVGYQKGGLTTDLRQRPSIKFQTEQFQYTRTGGAAATPTPATPDGGADESEETGKP